MPILTLDPTHSGGGTLSNGDLTLTGGSGWMNTRATGSVTGGQYYAELTLNVANSAVQLGIINASGSQSNYLGSNTSTAFGWVLNNGSVYGGTSPADPGTVSASGIGCMAVDFNLRLFWFRVNGGSWYGSGSAGNPATGLRGCSFSPLTTGPFFPAVCTNATGDEGTINFGASSFTYTAPAGFVSFNSVWSGGGGFFAA